MAKLILNEILEERPYKEGHPKLDLLKKAGYHPTGEIYDNRSATKRLKGGQVYDNYRGWEIVTHPKTGAWDMYRQANGASYAHGEDHDSLETHLNTNDSNIRLSRS